MCKACGRVSVMLTEGEVAEEGDVLADYTCPCGAAHIDRENIKNSTAGPICEFCYRIKLAQQQHGPS